MDVGGGRPPARPSSPRSQFAGIGIELELDTHIRPESNSESESIRSVGIELGVGIDVNRIDSAALVSRLMPFTITDSKLILIENYAKNPLPLLIRN